MAPFPPSEPREAARVFWCFCGLIFCPAVWGPAAHITGWHHWNQVPSQKYTSKRLLFNLFFSEIRDSVTQFCGASTPKRSSQNLNGAQLNQQKCKIFLLFVDHFPSLLQLRPTPPHLTSAAAEALLAHACENESNNAKRMRMGLEPLPVSVSQPIRLLSFLQLKQTHTGCQMSGRSPLGHFESFQISNWPNTDAQSLSGLFTPNVCTAFWYSHAENNKTNKCADMTNLKRKFCASSL